MSSLIEKVNQKYQSPNVKNFPSFRSGDTVVVHVRVTEAPISVAPLNKNAKDKKPAAGAEAAKTRIQLFEGIVIAINKKTSVNGSFRVRKMSYGIGVERVFPFHSPNVAKIEVVSRGKSRRAKHFYLREKEGKNARIAIDYDRKE